MNNLTADLELAEPKLVKQRGKQRDLLPYRLNVVIDFLRCEAAASDTDLEAAIAIVLTGMTDKTIPFATGTDLLNKLIPAFKQNDHIYDVLKSLRDSDLEVAQREVERIEAVRRNGLKKP